MNLTRNNSVYISEKAMFYARILAKATVQGSEAIMTADQKVDAEIIDKWENEFPALVLAYEENCKIRQQNKKAYEAIEKEIIAALSPIPGSPVSGMTK